MARVVIEVIDLPNGNISVVCKPTFAQLAGLINSGQDVTSAEACALFICNQTFNEYRRKTKESTKILIPKAKKLF